MEIKKITKTDIEEIISLTPLQEGMLFHYLQVPQNRLYCEQLSLEISGEIDPILFENAWNIVTKTNEMLRTVFRWEKVEKPSQIILKDHPCRVIFHDISSIENERSQTVLNELKEQDLNEGFDLQQVPFRVTLIKLAEKEFVMIISYHHILYDGWSNGIILKEFFKNYELCRHGKSVKIPLKTPFKEFVKWQQSQDKSQQKKFWHEYLAGIETITEIPIKNKKEKSTNVQEYSFALSKDTCRQLDIFSKNHRVTLAAVFYAAWGILLQRYCNSEDIIFGTTISGRSASIKQIENMVGLFINTLPLRIQSASTFKLIDVITFVENHLQEREAFESTPLPETGGGSLFDTIIVIENYPLDNNLVPTDGSLTLQSYAMVESTHYDLSVGIMMFDQIEIKFSFKEGLFRPEIIENLAGHFKIILQTIIQNPQTPVSQIEIITSEEKKRILNEFNDTAAGYPDAKTIHGLFAEQAAQTPYAIAVFSHGQSRTNTDKHVETLRATSLQITYFELNEQSNRLAGLLIERGVLPDSIVAIMMERSVEMVVGIMGILKAGGAYMPIDPEYPQERIDYILKDSAASILLTNDEKKTDNCQLSIVNYQLSMSEPQTALHQHSEFSVLHSNLAYIIYTSGSTGKPKGVLIEHASVVNRMFWIKDKYGLNEHDVFLQAAPFYFDVSVSEMFGWIPVGARLCLLSPGAQMNPELICKAMAKFNITIADFVPAMINLILDEIDKNSLYREVAGLLRLFTGAETVSPGLVKRFHETIGKYNHTAFINAYGPTESTVDVTHFECKKDDYDMIPIGKPIANVQVFILNSRENLQPLGITGELCIGGKGLARGYLNNPELTAERFKFNRSYRWSNMTYILYKTGDMARWLSDGNIEFLGRIDQQIKIRGVRVELGEIKNCLLKHEQVKDAVVLVKEDAAGDKFLAAYFVARREIPGKDLTEYLARVLPGYMIPAYFIRLTEIPLTPGGKVDRKALPEPELKNEETYAAPRDDMEKKLVEIWGKVLGRNVFLNPIGTGDNFFLLGGHSLKATSLVSLLYKTFNIKIPLAEIFKRPTIRQLSDYINNAVKEQYVLIEPVEKKDYYMLSSAQKRLYFLQQMDNAATVSTVYNMPSVWVLEGELDKSHLEKVFNKLIKRHESLRTSFVMADGEPVQQIHDEVAFEIEYKDLTTGDTEDTEKIGVIQHFIRAFDLSQAPLMRVGLLEEKGQRHFLMVDMHHIISDGTSMNILVKDFMVLYRGENLGNLRLQYKDFSGWQNNEKQKEFLKRQGNYWVNEFAGEIPVLELPADYPRPPVQSFAGSSIDFEIESVITGLLNRLAFETGTTLYMVLLAVYNVFLAKITNQEDIVVGSPIAGRRHADLEKIIGMFVNTLVMRNFPSGEKTFTGFLHELKEKTLSAFENQDYPFEDLVDMVVSNRDTSRNPVFDVMFVLQNMGMPEIELPGLVLKPYDFENKTAKFDLNLTGLEKDGKLIFNLEYSTNLFKKETALKLIDYFKNLIDAICQKPGARICAFGIMSKEEKERILKISNGTVEPVDFGETIHGMFEKIVIGNEDKTALVFKDGRMTYGELNRRANILAQMFEDVGIGTGCIVGLMIERSFELVTGMIGIMKAGGAYLPVDPNYPQERIDYMLKDSKAKVLIINKFEARSTKFETNPNVQKINAPNKNVEDLMILNFENLNLNSIKGCPRRGLSNFGFRISNLNSSNLAYVIYTSGSTGRPKGAMLDHINLVNLIQFHHKYTGIDCSKVLQFATISFDASFHEIFSALLAGGELYLIDEETRNNIPVLLKYISKNKIKTLFLPMAFLKIIFNDDDYLDIFPKSVEHIQSAGEQVVVSEKFKNYLKENNVFLHNHYGPSETHVITTFSMDPREDIPEFLSIGKPIQNTGIYILDKAQQLLPIGVAGELYAKGLQVGRGYLNNPELTCNKFKIINYKLKIINGRGALRADLNACGDEENFHHSAFELPRIQHSILYRTGDMARWLSDGNIEFLGRIDHQVKIRGIRVEPGEIESQLKKIKIIKDTLVVVKQDAKKEKYLCAYIVLSEGTRCNDSELRNILSVHLPDYMIPSYFVQIGKMPLSPSGKIDKKALPEPGLKCYGSYIAPRNEVEKKLAGIWSEVIGRDKDVLNASQLPILIGIDDNFFQLGGNSLKAIILISKIHKIFAVKIPLSELFKHPRIRELAGYIKNAAPGKFEQIELAEKKEYYKLSSAQKRLYVLQQIDKDGTAYNLSSAMIFSGLVDENKLAEAVKKLIRRHESFRTSFVIIGEEPVQRIHDSVEFEIEYKDLAADTLPQYGRTWTLSEVFGPTFFQKGGSFDLSQAPLLRVGLVRIEEERHLLIVDMHHIISDGMSIQVLVKDFSKLYAGIELPGIKYQYKDYAEWQNREKLNKKIQEQGAYWKKEFEGEIPVLELPLDFTRPTIKDFEGSRTNFEISKEISNSLKVLALETGSTLYTILLALYIILLSKLSSQEDIVVGAPVAGRRHADLEKIIGMFVNTLALRNYPVGEKQFINFLEEVKEIILKGFENQEYQYEELIEQIVVNRDAGRNPLFDTMFVLQNTGSQEIEIPGLKLFPYEYENKTAKFDLTLSGVEKEDKLFFTFEYSTKLFREETVQGFIAYFKEILNSVIENKDRRISDFECITEEEKKRILVDFNNTETEYPTDKTIHQLFEEQVIKSSDRIAVLGQGQTRTEKQEEKKRRKEEEKKEEDPFGRINAFGEVHLSYRELNQQSDRLAGLLVEKGIHADSIVAIMMERSLEMIIGLLGILKSGGAYLPIDPGYPQERIDFMVKDSNAVILLTHGKENNCQLSIVNNQLSMSEPQTALHQHSEFSVLHSNLAYIIYTSGSTGKPKGVLIVHRNVTRVVKNTNYIDLTSQDRILQLSNYAFDGSVFDIYGALLNSAALILIEKETGSSANRLKETILREQITVFLVTTALFNVLVELEKESLKNIRKILFGGERVSLEHAKKALAYPGKGKVIHVYGPTETTVYATYYFIDAIDNNAVTIPIGKPVSNTTVYIFDQYLNPVSIGAPGEIYIGGAGVARGYLNNPELTAEKFIDFPNFLTSSLPNFTLYRTGDLARWLSDGNIEFLRRIDQQVKIRGFRIELGEIERRLLMHEAVKDVKVVYLEPDNGNKCLCAYIVGQQAEFKEYLLKILPDYMIPSYFMMIDKIPLTSSGKVDKKMLPDPVIDIAAAYTPPRDKVEKTLVEIWAGVLKVEKEKIGIDTSFFQLGGHSLNGTIMVSRIHKVFSKAISLVQIFKMPTIRLLAEAIKSTQKSLFIDIEPVEKKEYYELSYNQKRLWIIQQTEPANTSYNMVGFFLLPHFTDVDTVRITLVRLGSKHESFRTSFKEINAEPFQFIENNVQIPLEVIDISGLEDKEKEFRWNAILELEKKTPFDLARVPLLRVKLVKQEEGCRYFIFNMHHIISDGWSQEILKKDFLHYYKTYRAGQESPIEALPLQYKDFAVWQNSRIREDGLKEKVQRFWLNKFEKGIMPFYLPGDFERNKSNAASAIYRVIVNNEVKVRLHRLALHNKTSLFIVMFSVFNWFLARFSGSTDILCGIISAGREHVGLANIVGFFINSLPLKTRVNLEEEFNHFLRRMDTEIMELFESQSYPLELVLDELKIAYPEVSVYFNMLNIQDTTGMELETFEVGHTKESSEAKFDLVLFVEEFKNAIVLNWNYRENLFKPQTMEIIAGGYLELINAITLAEEEKPVDEMEYLNRVSLKLKDVPLSSGFTTRGVNTVKPMNDFIEFKKEDIEQSIGQCFEQQVSLHRDRIAVKVDERHLTYDALDYRANRVAHAVLREYDDSCCLSAAEETRYKRQMMLHRWGIEAQEKLKRTTVFVAGAGGSGSPLIMQLALAGFGTIIICDFDEVELSNLNRQVLHDESRIGMNKALSAAQTVYRINPNVRVIAYSQKVTRDNIKRLTANASIIFDNVDDMEAKFILSQWAVQENIPHIISSMIDMNAYAAIFHTPHTPCYHCLYDRGVLDQLVEMKQLMKDYQKNPNPVASPALFLSTGFAVNEAVKIVLGFDKERPAYNKFFLFNQRGLENILDSDGYRQLIYPFSPHFRELSRQQGFDWDKGWQGRFLEEIEVGPNPYCPACGKEKKEELEPFPVAESSEIIEPVAYFEPASAKDKNIAHLPAAALLFGHDTDMVIGIMGALKSGKIYVPLDPGYPGERLTYMLEDSGARLIITGNANYRLAIQLKERVNKNISIVNIDEIETGKETGKNPGITIEPKDPAYILYTSGSTGQPKGVMQSHRNVLHFARVYANALHLNRNDRLTLFSSYSFDAAKMDIFGALLNGGTLFPYDIKKEGNLIRLAAWLEAEGITIYHSIPTLYRYFTGRLTGAEKFKHLRLIVLGGEAVFKKDVETYKKYFPADCLFVNGLGPTESTVTLQYFIDKNTEVSKESVPVGYPAAETVVLLLDEDDRETVGYGIGEIVYKSDYLALGYLHNREKTDEVFVKNPLTGKDRVYRSGDLGRRLVDGSIEYMGRKDSQVKVRGYRVELQEIEGKLDKMPGIKKSAVICQQDEMGESYLIAYYVLTDEINAIDEIELAGALRKFLPDYMVPGAFYRLNEFPFTATGKIDRKALNGLAENLTRPEEGYVEPSEGIEQTLAGIWKKVLRVERIGVYDNFFLLRGNSLKAIILVSQIEKTFGVKIPLAKLFKTPRIRELAKYIKDGVPLAYEQIELTEKKKYYALASAQKRLYFLQQMDKDGSTYNLLSIMMIEGMIDKVKFEQSIKKLIRRHESLRTSFHMVNDETVQKIHDEVEFEIEYKDIAANVPAGHPKKAKGREEVHHLSVIIHNFIRPFDLSRAPLLRVGLFRIEDERHLLIVDMHHIISDGISTQVLMQDFSDLYPGKELPGTKLQYKDYAAWQNREKNNKKILEQSEYWQKEFEGEIPVLELPIDYARPALQSFEGDRIFFEIDRQASDALKALALESRATMYIVLMAIYNIFLAKLSGREDIVVGSPVVGRRHADLDKIIGMFVNTLALRNWPLGEKDLTFFLQEVKERTLKALENQEYQYEDLVEKVAVIKDISHNPLFDTMFILQNFQLKKIEIPGLKLLPYNIENKTSKFDISLTGMEVEEKWLFTFEYCTKLFKRETIERFIAYFKNLVNGVIENKNRKRICDFEILTEEEKKLILFDFNDTAAIYPKDKTIHSLFAEQAAQTPYAIALFARGLTKGEEKKRRREDEKKEKKKRRREEEKINGMHLSYRELNEQSNRLAGLLIEKGIVPVDIIAIMAERSVETIVGILGILKSGAAYMPIDPEYPQERIDYILKDSNAVILLTHGKENNCQLSIINCQ